MILVITVLMVALVTMTFLVSGYTSLCLPEVCEGCLFSHMLLNLKIFARSVYKVEHMFSRVLAARVFFFGDVLIHILSP